MTTSASGLSERITKHFGGRSHLYVVLSACDPIRQDALLKQGVNRVKETRVLNSMDVYL